MKNLNSGCGVDFQYFIKNKLCLRAYYGLYLFCFLCYLCYFYILFLISVNRSFIVFTAMLPATFVLGFLHYSIANVVFVVFKIAICVVWGAGIRAWDIALGCADVILWAAVCSWYM